MSLKKTKKKNKNNHARTLDVHYNSKSPVAEQFRAIRTNIQFAAVDRSMQSILVTSTAPGEGKSTVAVNLAAVMAQQGYKTLLIDADMRKPTAHYTFGISNTRGLTNMLTNQIGLEDAIHTTEVDKLDLLSSGPVPPNPAELLGARAMEMLLMKAAASYDNILIDSPPVLAVTDAQVLAHRCDGTILVTSSGKTDGAGAQKAKDLLAKSDAHLLGAILNRKSEKKSGYYYYYG